MPDTRAVAVILEALVEVMADNEEGVIERRDDEFLHDFRVAVRRTRSALSLFGTVLPPAVLRRGRRFFKDLGGRTNPARELDVLLLGLPVYAEELSAADREGLEALEEQIAGERARQYAGIRRWLEGKTYRRAIAAWRSDLAKLSSTDGGGTMAVRAAKAIRKAAARANRQTAELGTGDRDAAIHRLRIRFKKLRHALEFSRSLTPGAEVQRFIGSLKRLQDELGAHQDLVVHGERLAELARASQSGSVVLILVGDRLVESLRRRRSILRESIEADVAGFRRVARSELERVLAALG